MVAQSDFQKGYVINNDQDTLHGWIDNKAFHFNAQHCDFKTDLAGEASRYKPSDLQGYRFVGGKFYVTKEVDGALVFLEYLIDGIMDIYFYQGLDRKARYYAQKEGSPLLELRYEAGTKRVDGTQYSYENKHYTGPLKYLTNDYPLFQHRIDKMGKLKHKEIISLAEDYHEKSCDYGCIVYSKSQSRRIILGGHTGYSNLFFPADDNVEQIFYMPLGVRAFFQQSLRNERMYFGIGLVYEGQFRRVDNTGSEAMAPFLRVPISVSYINNRQGFSPFFAAELDISAFFITNAYEVGLKYQTGDYFFLLSGNLKTSLLFDPYGASLNIGAYHFLR